MNSLSKDIIERDLIVNPYNENFDEFYPNDNPGLNFNHKLRDFEEFTARAQHFREFNRYTNYPYNRHPSSRYFKFWKEEKRRCLEGYNIGRDWIPGYFYWYLNYQRVQKAVYKKEDLPKLLRGEKVKAKRIEDFPDPWDYDYYFYHYVEEGEQSGRHGSVLKSRGKGYSYKGAGMVNRNYFLIPKSLSYVIANESGYLDGTDGILTRAYQSRDFVNKHTEFFKHSQARNVAINYRASYFQYDANKRPIEVGYLSEVIGIPLKNNIGRARGKRGILILWEESGNFPGLLEAWQIARESVEQDGAVYGYMLAFGTAGSEPKSFENLKEMFLKPEAYGILSVPDIWSKKRTKKKVSLFVPSYTNMPGLTDKDGNSDIVLGYKLQEKELESMRLAKAETSMIIQKKMEKPKHPEEALLRKGRSMFNINLLRDVLANVDEELIEADPRYIGRMGIDYEGKVVFLESEDAVAIENFPHDNTVDNSGAIVIFKKPARKYGKPLPNVYIAGSDPYDQDKSTTNSLGSLFIMNSITGEIVAEYTGRPATAEEYWEQARLLLLYYDARVNFENDLIGFKNHLKHKGNEYLMVDTPEVVLSIEPNSKVERTKGTHATTKINRHARTLIANYINQKIDENSERTYAYTIKSKPLLQELIDWDIDGNYDRVSALGMLMILYESIDKEESSMEETALASDDEAWNELLDL